MINTILKQLGLDSVNSGFCATTNQKFLSEKHFSSINPTTEKIIASIQPTNKTGYEFLIQQSCANFEQWRKVLAPQRGECIRLIAEELRSTKMRWAH